jgi:hypothetical protein
MRALPSQITPVNLLHVVFVASRNLIDLSAFPTTKLAFLVVLAAEDDITDMLQHFQLF